MSEQPERAGAAAFGVDAASAGVGHAQAMVTLLFTDIEGSTARWERDPAGMRVALREHDALLRAAVERRGGEVFKTVGDAFCCAFAVPLDAVAAALDAQRALAAHGWGAGGPLRVRMALHTGEAERRDGDYFGQPLNRVARLLATAHGGQVVLSSATAALAHDGLGSSVDLRDLGEHHLRDLARPERVFQLVAPDLAAEFPPLRSLNRRRHNLPAQATALIGREREVAAARALLLSPDTRLLTMTGPGGVGKTRLALQVAAESVDDFADGVWFVPLAAVTDPLLVAPAIGLALALHEAGARSASDTLHDALRARRALLVLDNFEQVVAAATEITALLTACPGVRVLVTSRFVLRVYGEREYAVQPLRLPEPSPSVPLPIDDLVQYEAVRLFVERAQAVRPTFGVTAETAPTIAEICRRLDGLPLAIELAAARVRLLPVGAILERLEDRLRLLTAGARDLPARQRTLREAIAWSHDLLDPAEQRLFRRLAVFDGGWTMEAAEAVCDVDGDLAVDVLDGLASLLEKSFVRRLGGLAGDDDGADADVRFGLLETLRAFGLEQLREHGEAAALRRRHADYFLGFAREARTGLLTDEQLSWLARLDREHGNIRAALDGLRAAGDALSELRLVGDAWWVWWFASHLSEGRRALDRALAGADQPTAERATALLGAGVLAWLQSDYGAAQAYLEESCAIFELIGDRGGLGRALVQRSQARLLQHDGAGALPDLARGEALLEEAGDVWGLALARLYRGNAAFRRGDYAEARRLCEQCLAGFRSLGGAYSLSAPLNFLGGLALQRGDYDEAERLLGESLAIRTELGDTWESGHILNTLGDVARTRGDVARAEAAYAEARACFGDVGSREGLASVLHNLGYVAIRQADAARAGALFAEALGLFRALADERGVVDCLTGLAAAAGAAGRPEVAAGAFGAAEAAREALGAVIWPSNVADYERSLAGVRAALGAGAFATAWGAGRGVPLSDAVACVLPAVGQGA